MFKCYRKAMIHKEAVPIKSAWMAISKKQSHLKPITDFYLLFFIASSLKEIGREKNLPSSSTLNCINVSRIMMTQFFILFFTPLILQKKGMNKRNIDKVRNEQKCEIQFRKQR